MDLRQMNAKPNKVQVVMIAVPQTLLTVVALRRIARGQGHWMDWMLLGFSVGLIG